MEVVLIAGMLASGKSIAMRSFQDLGYYCIDNIPPSLIKNFLEISKDIQPQIEKAAFVVDVRLEGFIKDLDDAIIYLKENTSFKLLFVDADDQVLISRYKLNRRRHLMFDNDRIEQTVAKERSIMFKYKEMADYVIDTSNTTEAQFKTEFMKIFSDGSYSNRFDINIVSFGYKYGLPKDCDLVFDVRFLPNPYYIPNLKPMCGLDKEVSDYVFSFEITSTFFKMLTDMLEFLIPYYKGEGKSQLVIGIGCSGGRHRSVGVSQKLYEALSLTHQNVSIEHRDVKKEKYIRGLE